jgi:hypothetical protein
MLSALSREAGSLITALESVGEQGDDVVVAILLPQAEGQRSAKTGISSVPLPAHRARSLKMAFVLAIASTSS